MGAGGVGDPGLVAGDLPAVAIAPGAGAQRAEVRPGVGFGEDRRRQHLARGEFRQPFGLLRGRAAAQDQFGRDFRPGAERTHADVAARQFFRHHHHRRLGQAKPAEFLGDGQAKDAHAGQFVDDLHRDQLVAQVPAMRMRGDPVVGKPAELVADHREVVVKPGIADGGLPAHVLHRLGQRRPRLGRVAFGDQPRGGRAGGAGGDPEIARPGHLALAHRQAAVELRQVFAKADAQDQRLGRAEPPLARQPVGPALQLAQRLGIGGDPGQRMRGVLVLVKLACIHLARRGDPGPQVFRRRRHQSRHLGQGGRGQGPQVAAGQGSLGKAVTRHGSGSSKASRRG
jgi:hypothetical protein